MKKNLIALAFALLCAEGAMAVPAYPGKMRVQQPDGTYITIQMRGDEHFHITCTEDGYPLVRNEQGVLEYAQLQGGQLVASGIRATETTERPAAAKAFLQTVSQEAVTTYFQTSMQQKLSEDNALRIKAMEAKHANQPARAYGNTRLRISDVPTTGKRKALAVLVQFPGKSFSSKVGDANEFYTDLLNKENYTNSYGATGSAHDFYKASSYGLYDPEFTVIGPVTLSHSSSYYASNSGTEKVPELVYEVAQLIDDQVDFSEYDTDGDGYVDNMYIFHAGYGQADTNKSDCIWAHNYNISYAGYNLTLDGVKVDRYAISQELLGVTSYNHNYGDPVAIGTFVHEFGHVLGIPDLYNTQNTYSSYTLGDWSTMCTASYLDDQCTPPLYSAYERYALGWTVPTVLKNTDSDTHELTAAEDGDAAYVINIPGKSNEYYLLENRQKQGWDKYLSGHGMLVWHIDENSNQWYANTPNNNASHQYVALERADGTATAYSEAGDPFPGTSNVTTKDFTEWGGKTAFGLAAVSESNGKITFRLNDNGYNVGTPGELKVDSVLGHSAVASWTAATNAKTYKLTLKKGAQTVAVNETADLSYKFTGLDTETEYELSLVAADDAWTSDTLRQTFTTSPMQFVEKQVVATEATAIDSTAFTANWEALDGAEEYLVTLYGNEFGTTNKSLTYGFNQKIAGMPEGWSCVGGDDINNNYVKGRGLRLQRYEGIDKPYLRLSRPDSKLTGVTFRSRTNQDGNTMTIEVWRDGKVADDPDVVTLTTKSTFLLASYEYEPCDSIRLVFNDNNTDKSSSYVGVDDVTITYIEREPTVISDMTDISAGTALSHTFTGLTPDTQYFYTVRAKQATDYSLVSNTVSVKTLAVDNGTTAIDGIATDQQGITREVFDLQGRRINDAQLPRGLYIIRENGKTKKVLVK